MYRLAIIGGGIHGSMLFINLPKHLRLDTVVIDNHKSPLSRFISQCHSVGVQYLRSPGSHCLSCQLNDLFVYAHHNNIDINQESFFQGRYYTPHLDVFLRHSNFLLKQRHIASHWKQCEVQNILWDGQAWHIHSNAKTIVAKKIILATGASIDATTYTPWNMPFKALDIKNHILHPTYEDPPTASTTEAKKTIISVVGSGMSGIQLALRLAEKDPKNFQVHIIGSSKEDEQKLYSLNHFDSKPCFIGPKCLPSFLNTSNYTTRHEMLAQNRHPGSINPFVETQYLSALKNNLIHPHITRVKHIAKHNSKYALHLHDDTKLVSDFVVCATGYNKNTDSQNDLVAALVKKYNLPQLAHTGTPILSSQLEWISPQKDSPRNLYLTGTLAELQLGPAARNIIGAHLAYRRLSYFWNDW